jgi:beta-1,4-mannooligosaccharide/beta-1,4-mannosyl-N-acetylglucosamine phosphorylase
MSFVATSESLFMRYPGNPLLSPERWPYPINAVMNAGATRVGDQTVLVCRAEDRRGFSHLACAWSRDGASNWVVDEQPALVYDADHPEEEWGLEDPRVTRVDELDAWIITYTAFGRGGPGISLAKTSDFRSFERLGLVMTPEDKNGVLLPRRVEGQWILFHRPTSVHGADIWLSRSLDLSSWSTPELVMSRRPGGWWDSARIGMGTPPLETAEGWLVVYHGVRQTVAGGLYRAGLALLDLDSPAKVLRRGEEWVLGPQAQFEVTGDVPNVVFPCGLVRDDETDTLSLYYGAADTRIGLATANCSEVLEYLRECPPG